MKNKILTMLLLLLVAIGFSQSDNFNLERNMNTTIKNATLLRAEYINDLSPLLWSQMAFPFNGDFWLYHRRINNFAQPQTENYLYPQDDYKQIVTVVFTEISVTTDGKTVVTQSTSDKLTAQQKNSLTAAVPGSVIEVKLKYKYKDQTKDSYGDRNKTVAGSTQVTLVPAIEAEYPGGFKQLSAYFAANVMHKITDKKELDKILNATIEFTVDEYGEVTNARIAKTTADKRLDNLLLEAINKMPRWKPAADSKGEKVKQEFTIPFSSGC